MKARFDGPEFRSGWFAPAHYAPEAEVNETIVESNRIKLLHDLDIDRHLKLKGPVSVFKEGGPTTMLCYTGDMHLNRENGVIHGFGPVAVLDPNVVDQQGTITVTLEVFHDFEQADEDYPSPFNRSYSIPHVYKDKKGRQVDLEEELRPAAWNTLLESIAVNHD
jgi:hypothetical protein